MKDAQQIMSRDNIGKASFSLPACSTHFTNYLKILVASAFIAFSLTSSRAAYTIQSKVEKLPEQIQYTWTVNNQDESWGLDMFAMDVPAETRILSHTEPPAYKNPKNNAYWMMEVSRDAQIDSRDGKAWLPKAVPGRKWIIWRGIQSPSVYPPGSTATFLLTTDGAVQPGTVTSVTATYTPRNRPHFYRAFQGQVIGPSSATGDTSRLTQSSKRTLASESQFISISAKTSSRSKITTATSLKNLSISLFPCLILEGTIGETYGIQYSIDLSDPTAWHDITNVTLTTPKQVWVDPIPPSDPHRFYRIIQTSITGS